jgi:hypothetical protein
VADLVTPPNNSFKPTPSARLNSGVRPLVVLRQPKSLAQRILALCMGIFVVVAAFVAWQFGYSSITALVSYVIPVIFAGFLVTAMRTHKLGHVDAATNASVLDNTMDTSLGTSDGGD